LVDFITPLRCAFTILDSDDTTPLYVYDPFNPNSFPGIQAISLNLVGDTYGNSTIRVFDDTQFIDWAAIMRRNVIISCGKTAGNMKRFLYGNIQKISWDLPGTNQCFLDLQLFGTQIHTEERLAQFSRSAGFKFINDSTVLIKTDKQFAYNLIEDLLTTEGDVVPLGADQNSIQEGTKYDLAGISHRVNNFIAAVSFDSFVAVKSIIDSIANLCGAIWYVNEFNKFVFTYPKIDHSGILLRVHDNIDDLKAEPPWVSFCKQGAKWSDDTTFGSGFGTHLVANTRTTQASTGTSSTAAGNSSVVFHQDLAQQFKALSPDFSDIALFIEKRGDFTGDLHCHIVEDQAGRPEGEKVVVLDIPAKKLPQDRAKPFYFTKLKFKRRVILDKLYWIILFEDGDDADNTVAWWNDGGTTGTSAFRDLPDGRSGVHDPDHNDNTGWTVATGTGVQFAYSLFDIIRYLSTVVDYEAVDRFGWIERTVDLSWSGNTQTSMSILHSMLAEASKAKRDLDFPACTIPDFPYMFTPQKYCSYYHDMAGMPQSINPQFKITEVNYRFSAAPDQFGSALGTRTCSVKGLASIDYLRQEANDPNW
jgi:hypothetical protein